MKDDKEFWAMSVKSVEPASQGWTVTGSDGWSMYVQNTMCDVAPVPGEPIKFYGRGIGYPVRGIVIGGRVYKYQTPEVHEAEQAEMRARLTQELADREAAFRASEKPKLASFKLRDAEGWAECVKNNDDPYGFRVVQYAADWASFMEREMAKGSTVTDCAESTSREADTDGITGFMYGAAVSILSGAWEHGEELRRWHNKDTQIGDEGDQANESGGVLNPALLSIGR